jgi:hypothetical protein
LIRGLFVSGCGAGLFQYVHEKRGEMPGWFKSQSSRQASISDRVHFVIAWSWLANLEGSGYGAKRDGEPIPTVDCYNCGGESDQFLFVKLLPGCFVCGVGNVVDTYQCYCFRPGERGTLTLRIEWRLAPEAQGVEPLLRFPARPRHFRVHVHAIGASVDERRPQLYQLEESRIETALVNIMFKRPHSLPKIGKAPAVIDSGFQESFLSLGSQKFFTAGGYDEFYI